MNPFQEHANNMAAYETELAEPINGVVGNSIQYPLAVTGVPSPSTTTYPATVGHFMIKQVLMAGGLSPRLVGQAIVRKSVLKPGVVFKTGQRLLAAQVGGSNRLCQIEEIEDTFTEYRLNLWDISQSA